MNDVVKLWDKYGLPEDVRKHCRAVAELAVKIASKIKERGNKVDIEAVKLGALLHDIGRAITHDPFQHFIKSAEILRKEGLDEKIVRIAERHFSAGLTAEEARKLGLPPKDYMPETLEEKIVSFADNLVFGDRPGSFEDFIKRLEEIKREKPDMGWFVERSIERAKKIKEEIEKLSGLSF